MHGCDKPDDDTCDFVKEYLKVVDLTPKEAACPFMVAFEVARKKYPQMGALPGKTSKIESLLVALGTNHILSGEMNLARHCAASVHFFRRMDACRRELHESRR